MSDPLERQEVPTVEAGEDLSQPGALQSHVPDNSDGTITPAHDATPIIHVGEADGVSDPALACAPGDPDASMTESPDAKAALDAEVDVYRNFKETTRCDRLPLREVLKRSREGWNADLVQTVRQAKSAGDKAKFEALKDTSMCFTLSGCGTGKTEATMVTASGLVQADCDAKDNPALIEMGVDYWRDRLGMDPHIVFSENSISGTGVKAGVLVKPDFALHLESFAAVEDYFWEKYGLKIDRACKNRSRLYFLTHDPKQKLNPAAVRLPVPRQGKNPVKRSSAKLAPTAIDSSDAENLKHLREPVCEALRYLRRVEGRPPQEDWRTYALAARKALGEVAARPFLLEVFGEEEEGEYDKLLKVQPDKLSLANLLRKAVAKGWKCPPLLGLTDAAKAYVAKVVYAGRDYMVPTANGYSPMRVMQVRRHLADAGVPPDRIDDVLTHIEKTQSVDAVLDLFGRKAGIHEINGHRLLISRDTILMASNPGDCTTLRAFLVELFGEEQLVYFLGWLKKTRRDFAAGSSDSGQFLIIIGDVKTGKSLLIAILVLMLGGRYASGYSYLTGKSDFNKEIITAGITGLDDELDSMDAATRSKIRARLKSFAFSRKVAVTPKGVDQKTLEPVGRIVIVGNATEEVMQVVPRKTDDMADKVMLLKAHRVHGGTLDKLMADGVPLDALKSELPAFLDFVERFEIPANKTDLRTGIASYWNPELVTLMDADDEDAPAIELIQKHHKLLSSVKGGRSASDILSEVLKGDVNARLILGNPTGVTFGRALARIARKRPDLLRKCKVVHRTAYWEILA